MSGSGIHADQNRHRGGKYARGGRNGERVAHTQEAMKEADIQFRWEFYDDGLDLHWSRWHDYDGQCGACCCGGPKDGEHQEPALYYDEGGLTGGHGRCDPDDEDYQRIEFRDQP